MVRRWIIPQAILGAKWAVATVRPAVRPSAQKEATPVHYNGARLVSLDSVESSFPLSRLVLILPMPTGLVEPSDTVRIRSAGPGHKLRSINLSVL